MLVEFFSFMAALLKPTRINSLFSRLEALVSLQKFEHTFSECERQSQLSADTGSGSVVEAGQIDFSKWKKLNSRIFGINRSMIPPSPWTVLKILQSEGFEAYLVGGCVRDLILNRIPKDFDVITSARLPQIRKQFHRCEIVGRRFPICRVHVKGSIVEVSSFDTVAKHCEKKEEIVPEMPKGFDHKDFILWNNSMHRDFTINSLFFDPFVNRIYDYANAMLDLRSLKLRTLVPAHLSFGEDCARILRGLRLAARLNLSFMKEIEDAIYGLSSSIMSLSKARIMMELNYMMSYGAAKPSLSLLKRYNILEILLPFHGAYLAQQARIQSSESSVMLMKLFSSLDRWVTCGQPSHDSVWVALLAFHAALITHPQHAFVILTFASVLYHANWAQGVNFAEKHYEGAAVYAPEVSGSQGSISGDELAERVAQLALHAQCAINILADRDSLMDAMSKFHGAPCSGLVFVSRRMGKAVELMFDIRDATSLETRKKSFLIDYDSLGKGHMRETRFLLGRVILDTIAPGVIENVETTKLKFVCEEDNNDLNEKYESPHNKESRIHFLDQELERADTVTKKKTEGECAQLPKDEIRTLLEEVNYRVDCHNATDKKKKNDDKHQKAVVNHLNLLLKGERGPLQEHGIEEVNEKLDRSSKNHKFQGKKLGSGKKSKPMVSKEALSALFR